MDIFLCSDPAVGSLTQIITAIAAIVAAGTGLWGVTHAVRNHKVAVKDAARRATNERRDQARFVHAVVGLHFRHESRSMHSVQDEHFSDRVTAEMMELNSLGAAVFKEGHVTVYIIVTNDSDEVISDISATLDDDGRTKALQAAFAEVDYMLPKSVETLITTFPWPDDVEVTPDLWRALVTFTDARDNVWTRETGRPVLDFVDSF